MLDSNIIVEKFNTSELYPNQKIAFEKNGDTMLFYTPTNHELYAEINLKTNIFKINDANLFEDRDLFQITPISYFSPKKYSTFYKYSKGLSGTKGGDFFTFVEFNELGLIKSIEKKLPEKTIKYLYKYNKYGQLLKIIEDKLMDKTLFENKYDEKCRLISQKKNFKETKSARKFFYDKNGNITKEDFNEQEIASNGNIAKDEIYTLIYKNNDLGQLKNKHTSDENHSIVYEYDSDKNLTKYIEYSANIDKTDPDEPELDNHFIKKSYIYESGEVIKEKIEEYRIVNASILIDKKWQAINIDEQRKLAWKEFNEKSAISLIEIQKEYNYQLNEISVTSNEYSLSIKGSNTKEVSKELLNSDIIKFILDSNGKILKKETTDKNKNIEVQTYLY